jgi:hypothetical protein
MMYEAGSGWRLFSFRFKVSGLRLPDAAAAPHAADVTAEKQESNS